jgi:hypothetical protein
VALASLLNQSSGEFFEADTLPRSSRKGRRKPK